MIPLKDGSLKSFGYFHGASYSVAPNGSRTPGLSRVNEGLHITELDLNLCRQVGDACGHKVCSIAILLRVIKIIAIFIFQMNQRLELYGQKFLDASKPDFKPQIVNGK